MVARMRGLAVLAAVALAALAALVLRAPPAGSPQPAPGRSDEVVRVVDGDTVVLRAAGKSRLIGVDTPEVFGREECFGREASAFAKRLLRTGLRVRVERDVEPRDRYGRALVYLRLPDRRSFNELLVARGYAVPLTVPPNVRHAGRFRALARRARERAAGLWSPRVCGGARVPGPPSG
jgi:micrococcal nuclease